MRCYKCGLEIKYDIEFCPKCLCDLGQKKCIESTYLAKYNRRKYIIFAVVVAIIIAILLLAFGLYRLSKNHSADMKQLGSYNAINIVNNQYFDTGNNVAYNPLIKEDLRDSLTSDNSEIVIDYSLPEDVDKGIFGIGINATKETVLEYLGEPNQDMGNEYSYLFDGRYGHPSLHIYFDDAGKVLKMLYFATVPM